MQRFKKELCKKKVNTLNTYTRYSREFQMEIKFKISSDKKGNVRKVFRKVF